MSLRQRQKKCLESERQPTKTYMGGCPSYGLFWGTINIRCRTVIGIQKGTIIGFVGNSTYL